MSGGGLGFLGGIGLFVFGMFVMTEALKALASARMRAALARFTTTPALGVISGAVSTALLQSSSATILTVIGFVGAGLMTFSQSVAVIFGANVGSTATGWVVALVGLKLQLGTVAMPLLSLGALLAAVGRDRRRQVGLALSGFSLIFLGLEVMQAGSGAISDLLLRTGLPSEGLVGMLVLVLTGIVITSIIQSSGAGVAIALVLLQDGSLSLLQAGALVIGMDLGTTVKSILATLGGSTAMRRTAMAHVGYNLVADALAFLALPALPMIGRWTRDDATALVSFHTGFNLAGIAILLPLIVPFSRVIERLVPADSGPIPQAIDRHLLQDASAALDAARSTAEAVARLEFQRLAIALKPAASDPPTAAELLLAADDVEEFLSIIPLVETTGATRNRHAALLHLNDHLHRLHNRANQHDRPRALVGQPLFRRPVALMRGALLWASESPMDARAAARLGRIHTLLARRASHLRRSLLLWEHAGQVSPQALFDQTDGLRWLERVAHHTARIVHYAAVAAAPAPTATEAAAERTEP